MTTKCEFQAGWALRTDDRRVPARGDLRPARRRRLYRTHLRPDQVPSHRQRQRMEGTLIIRSHGTLFITVYFYKMQFIEEKPPWSNNLCCWLTITIFSWTFAIVIFRIICFYSQGNIEQGSLVCQRTERVRGYQIFWHSENIETVSSSVGFAQFAQIL